MRSRSRRLQRSGEFSFIHSLDMFKKEMPTFNVHGQTSIGTPFGAFLSVSIAVVTLLFAGLKLFQMLSFYNPTINENKIKDYYGNEDKLRLVGDDPEMNFMIAIAAEDYFTKKSLLDPRWLKLAAYIWKAEGIDGAEQEEYIELSTRPCTDEDYDKFYPVENKAKSQLESFKTRPDRQLYCIDFGEHSLQLQGSLASSRYTMLEISLVPCQVRLTKIGFTDDQIPPECQSHLYQEFLSFLNSPSLVVYSNQQSFELDKFRERRISSYSTFHDFQFDRYIGSWLPSIVQLNTLNDAYETLQYGQSDSVDFFNINFQDSKPSVWLDDLWGVLQPAKPDGLYKLTGLSFLLDADATSYERQTYSLLDWLGDIGGLFDALRLIAGFLVGPLASYALQVNLVSNIFTQEHAPSEGDQQTRHPTGSSWQFPAQKKIKKRGLCWSLVKWSRAARYRRMLAQASQAMKRELDLADFFSRLKMLHLVSLASLDPRQKRIVQLMSGMRVKLPSDPAESELSSDSELDQLGKHHSQQGTRKKSKTLRKIPREDSALENRLYSLYQQESQGYRERAESEPPGIPRLRPTAHPLQQAELQARQPRSVLARAHKVVPITDASMSNYFQTRPELTSLDVSVSETPTIQMQRRNLNRWPRINLAISDQMILPNDQPYASASHPRSNSFPHTDE